MSGDRIRSEPPGEARADVEDERARIPGEDAVLKGHSYHAAQGYVLELLAGGEPLDTVLGALVLVVEELSDGVLCSVSRVDEKAERLFQAAGPNLPEEYNRVLDGIPIGPAEGSCGTAAFRRERVVAADIASDPAWDRYREMALRNGLRACWSQPIVGKHGRVLGTFDMFHGDRREPSRLDCELIESAAQIAGVAIQHWHMEKTLRESEIRYRLVAEAASDAIVTVDTDDTIRYVNAAAHQLLRYEAGELLGRSVRTILPDGLCTSSACGRAAAARGPEDIPSSLRRLELVCRRKDGGRVLVEASVGAGSSGETELCTAVLRDISDRRRREEGFAAHTRELETEVEQGSADLRLSEARYRQLYDFAPDLYVTLDPQGTLTDVNQTALDKLGYTREESIGSSVRDWLSPADRGALPQWLSALARGRSVESQECQLLRRDGTTLRAMVRARVRRDSEGGIEEIWVAIRDITTRVALRQRLALSQRLAMTGRLAASVAHEINNPLQALFLHMSLVDDTLPGEFAARGSWNRIQEAVHRIQRTVGNLLDLHRVGRGRIEEVDVNGLVREALGLLETQLQLNLVRLEVDCAAELPRVTGVSQHVYQIVLNLLLNALDAMPDGGLLGVRTRVRRGQVALEVSDSGPGIECRDFEEIFDPLYSTRSGRGTGLGLFVTYGLVKDHHGEIEIDSTGEGGTVLRVLLPVTEEAVATRSA